MEELIKCFGVNGLNDIFPTFATEKEISSKQKISEPVYVFRYEYDAKLFALNRKCDDLIVAARNMLNSLKDNQETV